MNGRSRLRRNLKLPIVDFPEDMDVDIAKQNAIDGTMSSLDFVKQYLTNKLIFPPDPSEHFFDHSSLLDVEALGSGTFGTVRTMVYQPMEKAMAVKRIRLKNNGTDDGVSKSMDRVRQEVEASKAASNCPNIVAFFGITFYDGDAWMCMELMDLSLDKLYHIAHDIVKVTFDECTLAAVAGATINALEHMKKKHQIIHRDVKPSNILIRKTGEVKLCDFGICGYLQNSIATTIDAGCPPYMAPERLTPNKGGYNIKSDVWSLGISMVEIANGRFPYDTIKNAPIFEQMKTIVHGDPPLIDVRLSVPMRNFIMACIVKDCEKRADFETLKQTEVYRQHNAPETTEGVSQFVCTMYIHKDYLPPARA